MSELLMPPYQKRYNLKLDGIAGPETWGSLLGQNGSSSNGSYTGGGSSGKTSTSTNLPLGKVSDGTAAALDRLEKGYTPSSDVEAEQALLDSLAQLRPGDYESDFTAQLDALYQEISSRPGFSYDPGSDAAYQSYALQYARQGRAAMADTLGQTAHLTGGYGSSYAQSAAQQSYQRYLQQLSDVLPQLQSAAYSRYRDEGDALLDRYKLLQGQDEEAYGRWQDLVSAWQKEVSQAQSRYDQISSRDLKNYQLLLDYFADKGRRRAEGSAHLQDGRERPVQHRQHRLAELHGGGKSGAGHEQLSEKRKRPAGRYAAESVQKPHDARAKGPF